MVFYQYKSIKYSLISDKLMLHSDSKSPDGEENLEAADRHYGSLNSRVGSKYCGITQANVPKIPMSLRLKSAL